MVTESEAVNAGLAFSDSEERLSIYSLDAGDETEFAVEPDCPGIEDAVYAEPFHEVWIGGMVQIVSPEDWCVLGSQDRVDVSIEDTIAAAGPAIWPRYQPFMFFEERL
jgi:hypothetical protein